MSAQLCGVYYLLLWCLFSCPMSHLYEVCSTIASLLNWLMSAYLYEICLPVGHLLNCIMSTYLCAICLPGLCLLTCMMSAQLYDVCSTVWCLLNCMMSAQLYDVCSTVWCLPNCMMSALPDDVSLSLFLPTCYPISSCMKSALLHDEKSLLPTLYDRWVACASKVYKNATKNTMMSACLNFVCLPVWCLLKCMISADLYESVNCIKTLLAWLLLYCMICLP